MMLMKRSDTKSKEQIQAEELARLNNVEVKSVRERERDYAEARSRLGISDAAPQPTMVQQRRGSGGAGGGKPPGGGVQVAAPAGPSGPSGPGFGGRGRGKR